MLVDDAASVRVGVGAVICAGRYSIDGHAKPDLLSLICGSENEMQIARAKPVGNAAAFLVEGGFLFADRPVAAQRPLIEPRGLCRVDVTYVFDGAAGRDKILVS